MFYLCKLQEPSGCVERTRRLFCVCVSQEWESKPHKLHRVDGCWFERCCTIKTLVTK